MNDPISEILSLLSNASLWVTLLAASFVTFFFQVLIKFLSPKGSASNLSASYRVIFLGPPGAGKTTTITFVIDYIINSKFSQYVRLRGPGTIEAIEKSTLLLAQGKFPPKTSESDTDIYRMDYTPFRNIRMKLLSLIFLMPRNYRIELADFAGELTEYFVGTGADHDFGEVPLRYSDRASSNFLKWISESDRCLLFIDMSEYLEHGTDFANALTIKYTALWQRYLDLLGDQAGSEMATAVTIVHSKMDLVQRGINVKRANLENEQSDIMSKCSRDFSRLYRYLQNNSREFRIVYSSALLMEDDIRMGSEDLARSILPNEKIGAPRKPSREINVS